MADNNTSPITFVIPGQPAARTRGAAEPLPLPAELRQGTVHASVRVAASRDAGMVRVDAIPGTDIVAISIDGGPELVLHPSTARELLQAQAQPASRGAGLGAGEVLVSPTLRWPTPQAEESASRGRLTDFVGGIVVKAVDVIRDAIADPIGTLADGVEDVVVDIAKDKVAGRLAKTFAKRVDDRVIDGVHRLQPDELELKSPLDAVPATSGGTLVFIHGTFSSTAGGFGKLWSESPARVASIFKRYDQKVYALDHPTLSVSPIANALTLARTLPPDARLHLVTHSRGGLIAEVLARLCASPTLSAADLKPFPEDQQEQFRKLAEIVKARRLKVDRIVRVGSPIRGTLLASRRLDVYLSVLKWSMRLAGWPIASEVVDFLAAVAKYRLEPDALPGLEAQVPRSPLVQWLHADPRPIPGELRVIAGDISGDSILGWVKVLMSDGFYWTDNDIVVQTRSMYGGARRQAGAMFALDQGGKVLHTKYFAKDRAAEAISRAILDDTPRDFRTVGPLSWAGEESSGDRAAKARPASNVDMRSRPAVFLIPGVGASRLFRTSRADSGGTNGTGTSVTGKDVELVWPTAMATATLDHLRYADGTALKADGFVGKSFDALDAVLSSTHEVIRFPYDWRVPFEVEAERLAERIDNALQARASSGQPVRLLTHSSGALLARTVHLHHKRVWAQMMAHRDARVVMLAPPNAGMWLPMQVLSGDETFGGLLIAGAPPLSEPQVRDAFGTMPGFLQVQAALGGESLQLQEPKTWRHFADVDAAHHQSVQLWHNSPEQRELERWGTVSPDALRAASEWRKRLDIAAHDLTTKYAGKLAIVAGTGFSTASGIPEAALPDAKEPLPELVYLDTQRGDGRVTVASARLPGVATWSVRSGHVTLPSLQDALGAYVELLTKGTTDALKRVGDAPAVDEVLRRSRVSRGLAPPPPEDEGQILGLTVMPQREASPRRKLGIQVVNGDLMFVREPIVVGHYRSMRLTGTEAVLDRLLGGAMSRSLALDVYADLPETHEIFVNTHYVDDDRIRTPRPEAVVVVGLGEEGSLTAAQLVHTVRKGVIAWARRLAERRDPPAPTTFDLAATLIGSGGISMAASEVATLIAEAVSDADGSLEAGGLPRVGELRLIELYADRAAAAWRALMLQGQQAPDRYEINPVIASGDGALRRPPETNYRGADYDFVSIVTAGDAEGGGLSYSLDTRRARTDVTHQMTQRPLLLQLLESSDMQPTPQEIGRTLFNVLVPIEVEPFLGGSTDIVLELDKGTAGIPWELLDTNTGARQQSEPWAIRSKIVRKLRLGTPEPVRRDATIDDFVLVIGEPKCDATKYQRLPGARREAAAVAQTLKNHGRGPRVVDLIAPDDPALFGPDSVAILSALHQHAYRIIHIAGHGEPTITEKRQLGGVVLSPGKDGKPAFLSGDEVRGLRTVPELVFVNSCHVGARERLELLLPTDPLIHRYNRPAFAAGMAEALISIGVKCVVVAGWAVDDRVAEVFATSLYQALLEGKTFLWATAEARKKAWNEDRRGTTWAAFQCWGDPEWRYREPVTKSQGTDWERRHAGVASPESLVIALETITTWAKFDPVTEGKDARRADLREGIADLERRLATTTWGTTGRAADAFGAAYAESGDPAKAVEWYERALAANDGGASLRASEQLSNMRVRLAWKQVASLPPAGSSEARAAKLNDAESAIAAEIERLQVWHRLRPTAELASLLGSAYKRLAMVRAKAGDDPGERDAIVRMKDAYAAAEGLAGKDNPDVFYPAWHRLVGEAAQFAGGTDHHGLNPETLAAYRVLLERKHQVDADFWSTVGAIELKMVEAVAKSTLAAARSLTTEFANLGMQVPAPRMWDSVFDNSTFLLGIYRRRLEAQAPSASIKEELAAIDKMLSTLGDLVGNIAAAAEGSEDGSPREKEPGEASPGTKERRRKSGNGKKVRRRTPKPNATARALPARKRTKGQARKTRRRR